MSRSPVSAGAVVLVAGPSGTAEEETMKAVEKRYEGLRMVRTKAIKGKGAWYWAHLEPVLIRNPDTGLPKAVKLRCSLCDAAFSASNPSRTASEHLKRGTCPNFCSAVKLVSDNSSSPSSMPRPISSFPPPPPCSSNRKRTCSSASYHHHHHHQVQASFSPLAVLDPEQQQQQQRLMLSGGKEDLGPLAMLEDSVKKLKSPKASPGAALSKAQAESAVSLLADWVYEVSASGSGSGSGAVSFSSVEHPKFQAFLQQVGLPPIPRRELAGARLDARYEECRCETEARIRDAMFFQIASDGWNPRRHGHPDEPRMVGVTVNLPNGTSVFRKALLLAQGGGRSSVDSIPSKYAEELLWETITGVCGGVVQRCAGIVADRFKSKALRELENRNPWMVNLSCQLQGFHSLVDDFSRELPLFRIVAGNCAKLAHLFDTNSQLRSALHKHVADNNDDRIRTSLGLFSTAASASAASAASASAASAAAMLAMVEDVMASYHALHSVLRDESYEEMLCAEDPDPVAREVAEMIRSSAFWGDVEKVLSLVKLVRFMAQEIEAERPLVGQCLPLWDELRSKLRDWCAKYNIDYEGGPVQRLVQKRFDKNYHPAWSAAFILDPFYLTRDTTGKYLPPFHCLTPHQEKDVDSLVTRLVSPDEAHIALMELMKWRSDGLDPLYAQAVQIKQRDPTTGKMRIANPQSSRLVWETYLTHFKLLGKVAVRLIFLQATASGFNSNLAFLRWLADNRRSNAAAVQRAHKMLFIAANANLGRRDFFTHDHKHSRLFSAANGDDDDDHDDDDAPQRHRHVLNHAAFPDAAASASASSL